MAVWSQPGLPIVRLQHGLGNTLITGFLVSGCGGRIFDPMMRGLLRRRWLCSPWQDGFPWWSGRRDACKLAEVGTCVFYKRDPRSEEEANAIYKAGLTFLKQHLVLSRQHVQKNIIAWQLKPKLHQMEHLLLQTKRYSALAVLFYALCRVSGAQELTAGSSTPLWMRMRWAGLNSWPSKALGDRSLSAT